MGTSSIKPTSKILLLVFVCIYSVDNLEPPGDTDTVDCDDDDDAAYIKECNTTDMYDPIFLNPLTPEPGDFVLLTPDDVNMFLERPDIRGYINSFSDPFLRFLVEDTLRYCPYMELCNITLDFKPPFWTAMGQRTPCCLPCDCSPDCVAMGNCCPDSQYLQLDAQPRHDGNDVMETCMSTVIGYVSENTTARSERVQAFQICPDGADYDTSSRCNGDYEQLANITFNDVIPQTDSATMKTYRNIHCAKCNGADLDKLLPWSTQLKCSLQPTFSSTDALLTSILDRTILCMVIFERPQTVDVEYCSNYISKGNITGLWTEYDPDVFKACAIYKRTMASEKNSGSMFYKNPQCAVCNGIEPSSFLCNMIHDINEPTTHFSFSGLLRLDSPNDHKESIEDNCGPTAMFDELKKSCRNVTCPYNRIFKRDTCELQLETSNTVGYRVTTTIRPPMNIPIPVGILYEVMPQLREQIEDFVRNIYSVSICTSQIMMISPQIEDFSIIPENVTESGLLISKNLTNVDSLTSENFTDGDILKISDINEEDVLVFHIVFDGILIESIDFRLDIVSVFEHNIGDVVNQLLSSDGWDIKVNSSTGEEVVFTLYLKDDPRDYYNERVPYEMFDNWTLAGLPVDLQDMIRLSIEEDGHSLIPYFAWNESPGSCHFRGTILRLLSLRPCPMFSVNTTELGLIKTQNGLIYNEDDAVILGLSDYVMDEQDQDVIRICAEKYLSTFKSVNTLGKEIEYSAEVILSIVSTVISIVCLIVTLFTYCYLPQLRTLPGKNNMALVTSLLTAQGMYLTSSLSGIDGKSLPCKLIGGVTHFFWLLAIFWMNVCTFHMFRVLLKTRATSRNSSSKKHVQYHVYAILMSMLFVTVNMIVSMVTSGWSDIGYGIVRCYISTQTMVEVTFGIPAAVVVTSNLVMFTAIIVKLKQAPTISKHAKQERNYFLVFAKMSTITGTTWLFGFVYMWTGIQAFSFIFIILNGCQGLFVMLSFVCNRRTLVMFKERKHTLIRSSGGHTNTPVTMSTSIARTSR